MAADPGQPVNLLSAVAFLTELAALAILGVWGWRHGPGGWSWLLALAAPLAFAVFWGALLSPRAPVRWPAAGRLALKGLVFAVIAWVAWSLWGAPLACLFGLAAFVGLLGDLRRRRG